MTIPSQAVGLAGLLLTRTLVDAKLDPDVPLADLVSTAMDCALKEQRDEARDFEHRERREDAPHPPASTEDSQGDAGSRAVKPDQLYLDVMALRSAPLQALLSALIAVRWTTSIGRESPDLSGLREPISPLLLITAIAAALVQKEDRGGLLTAYVAGFPLQNAYDSLLRLPAYKDDLLAEHLQIEEELIEHFCVLSLSSGAANVLEGLGPTSSDGASWRDHWLRLNATARGGDWSAQASRDGVLWGAWLLANPGFADSGSDNYIQATLYYEGIVHNTQIHVVREELEQLATLRDAHFNALLRENLDVDVKRTALKRASAERALAVRVLDRARRFYIWNPCEIDARCATARFALELDAAEDAAAAERKENRR